jgi:hypothetical protein
MKRKKYKILVLSNLKDSTDNILKSTISLSKMVDSNVHFFHAKNSTDVVKRESQLSAMRTINREHLDTEKKIQKLIQPYKEQYNVNIDFSFAFGNIKEEISNTIKFIKPDIIVLGKRKTKAIKLLGDSITQFVIKNYNGSIMIASHENAIEPNKNLSIGLLNSLEETFTMEFANDLLEHIDKPIKSFKVAKKTNNPEVRDINTNEEALNYVFDHSDDAIQNLSNYISKSKVNLLCINRDLKYSDIKTNHEITDFKNAIKEFKVSILLTGVHKFSMS